MSNGLGVTYSQPPFRLFVDNNFRARPGPGPPPLLHFIGVQQPPEELRVIQRRQGNAESPSTRKNGPSGDGNGSGLFLYDPFQAKRKSSGSQKDPGPVSWVVGETGAVEIEVSNPSSVPMRVRRVGKLDANGATFCCKNKEYRLVCLL